MLFNFEGESLPKKRIVGVYDEEVPPVPIPNTVVKLLGAENTWLETARENRAMPTLLFFVYTRIICERDLLKGKKINSRRNSKAAYMVDERFQRRRRIKEFQKISWCR